MFRKIYRKIICRDLKSQTDEKTTGGTKEPIPDSLGQVKQRLAEVFSCCADFATREVESGCGAVLLVAYIKGLAQNDAIDRSVIKPLLSAGKSGSAERINRADAIEMLRDHVLISCEVEEYDALSDIINQMLLGKTAVFADGSRRALAASTTGFEARGVEQPDTNVVVRGPREGFTEVLTTNLSLLRRKIRNPELKFEMIKLGSRTNTAVCISYINNLVNGETVQTVRDRLNKINMDSILESGYIEEMIEDAPLSIFATVGNAEKPDIVAAKLLEGRVAILCDGTPFVLTVPYLFIETIQVSEDYYSRPYYSSFVRLLRLVALIITTVVPALYVALISFHQDMLPTELMIRIGASREGLPFSAFVESLMMVVIFELLREAGVRMPKSVGQAVNIVGALVIGQAAVDAGLVSDIMVIIIAITAISSFIVNPMTGATTLVRIAMLAAASLLGLMGIGLAVTAIFTHMCSLSSFGVPYMSPVSPLTVSDLKDTIVRAPLWAMLKRPKVNRMQDEYRMQSDKGKRQP